MYDEFQGAKQFLFHARMYVILDGIMFGRFIQFGRAEKSGLLIGILLFFLLIQHLAESALPMLPEKSALKLQEWGLTSIVASRWFILGLIGCCLHLVLAAVTSFIEVIQSSAEIPFLDPSQLQTVDLGPLDGWMASAVEVPLEPQVVQDFLDREYEKVVLAHDPASGRKMVFAVRGGWGRWGDFLWRLGLLILAITLYVSHKTRFEGKFFLEEGRSGPVVETLRGLAPEGWIPYRDGRQRMEGFHSPSFDFKLEKIETLRNVKTGLPVRFRSEGVWIREDRMGIPLAIESFKPQRLEEVLVFQGDVKPARQMAASIRVRDRSRGFEREFRLIDPGTRWELEGASFRVVQIEKKSERLGYAAEIEYVSDRKTGEHFWIFEHYPAYDSTRRRQSRYAFELLEVRPRWVSEYRVVQDEKLGWVVGGVLLFLSGWMLARYFSAERLWAIWDRNRFYWIHEYADGGWSQNAFQEELDRVMDGLNVEPAWEVNGVRLG